MSRVLWGLLAAALFLAVAVPTGIHVHATRVKHATARMVAIARQVPDPAPMSPLVLHHDCNGVSVLRCSWTPDLNVTGLASQVKANLANTAHLPARTQCWDDHEVASNTLRSCLVQVGGSSHATTIFLDPYVRNVKGRAKLVGTMYTVEAD